MNPFLQAVRDGDLMAAKAAYNSEMSTRLATAMTDIRHEVANSVPLPEHPVSFEAEND
ncbi:hypothetical protein [Citrobacter phage Ci1]|nr:hypothetical protein [Citrobacter phage Ci1]